MIDADAMKKKVLHVGPGHPENGARLPPAFRKECWLELRVDIDPANEPDLVGSMLHMPAVPDSSVDAVYSSHNIEHVYAHEVPQVLREFLRVLKPTGFLLVTCPDLQSVSTLIAQGKLTEPVYHSPAGPISPLDILYGHSASLAAGHSFMAHKGGFILQSLTAALQAAGFGTIAGLRRAAALDLWAIAAKSAVPEQEIRTLATQLFPSGA